MRALASAVVAFVAVLRLGSPSASALDEPENQASELATPAAKAPDKVRIDDSNSKEMTATTQGRKFLENFAARLKDEAPGLKATNAPSLQAQYRVIEVDVAKVLPIPGCKPIKETLVLPRDITEVRFQRGNIDTAEASKPCAYSEPFST